MIIGYARTSTAEQVAGLDAQNGELTAAGCERIFAEKISSVAATRPALEDVLSFARDGDTLVVTKLDRLARSTADFARIEAILTRKKVALRILGLGLDTATPTGRLMTNVLVSVAQFEREIMLERQREGIAAARLANKYKGRKPTAMAKRREVLELAAAGLTKPAIAKKLEIGVASVYRALRETPEDVGCTE